MHEFRSFIEKNLDERGWNQAELVRRSGLHRSHVSKLLKDQRDRLGQMPEPTTIESLSRAFGIPVAVVNTAAARALGTSYQDDGTPLTVELTEISTESLLNEIRRRIYMNQGVRYEDTSTQKAPADQEAHGAVGVAGTSITGAVLSGGDLTPPPSATFDKPDDDELPR